jgi:hypothetical protein
MKLRFSLRALLVLVAVLAAFGYWRSRPAAYARQFINAIETRDFEAADALFERANDRCVNDLFQAYHGFKINMPHVEQTARDWVVGEAKLRFTLKCGFAHGPCEIPITTQGLQKASYRIGGTVSLPPTTYSESFFPTQLPN